MTSLVEGARRLVGRSVPTVGDRLRSLEAAATAARGRLDDELVDRADTVVRRASSRLALSGDHTVVALAGATGSGKSSMFNALTGLELAQVSVRRPTTSVTAGAAWGDDAAELFEWLGVQRRHQVAAPAGDLDGLVLLDLPDHDSTEVAHHLEVDRLVQLVDMLVWVVDPQKYADAALHERYLRRLATHQDVMIVVLNHVDEVPHDERRPMVEDLRRLLKHDGLTGVPVLTTSATLGEGVDELRALVTVRVREKKAAAARLTADVVAVASDLRKQSGTGEPAALARSTKGDLVDAFADAAGVPTVVHAVQRSVARRGAQQTGWLVTSWLSRLKPDPLRRLHLDLGASGKELTGLGRASVPEPTRVQRARVDTTVRAVAERVGADLTPAWSDAIRRASVSRLEDLNDALDRAIVRTDLGAAKVPLWWRLAKVLQVVFAIALVAGAGWLLGLLVLDYLQMTSPEPPERYGFPLPTLLLLAGLIGGIALGVVGRAVNGLVARARARSADRRLRAAIAEVTEDLVLAPIDHELQAYAEVRAALSAALHR